MPTDFTLPELGENITAGDVVRVLVSPGDVVTNDQPLLELETDKATIEVPSTLSGTVKEIRVKQGEKIKVGQVVLTVEEAAGAPKDSQAEAPAGWGARGRRLEPGSARRVRVGFRPPREGGGGTCSRAPAEAR